LAPIVEIKGLSYTYPDSEKTTLTNINLSIDRGSFVVITGPSGCGKTTLCRCFNGLIPHFYSGKLEGDAIVFGLSIKEHSTSELAEHVGFVFQSPENQLFALSVEKDIAFGLENLAVPREEMIKRVEWAMDIVGIRDLRENAPSELSGGQQQRVAIASVLAMKPEIIVLDEPTSYLDPASAKKLFEVVHMLNKDLSLTIILVEHRLDLLSAYADRVIIMDKGSVKSDGDPREILSSEDTASLGIGIPKVTRIYQLLKEDGFDLGKPPISVEELVTALRSRLQR
jgi:energy-coupling factor transporter ATPase